MNRNTQSEVTSEDVEQHKALGAEDIIQQTNPANATHPHIPLRSQDSLINVYLDERSVRDEVDSRQWPQPPIPNKTRAGPCKGCSTSGVGQAHGDQRIDANRSSSFAQPNALLGPSLQHEQAPPRNTPPFTGQQQAPGYWLFRQPTKIANFEERLPKTCGSYAAESGYTITEFGLPTPASTNAKNSPYDGAEGTNPEFGSQGQQLWGHNFDSPPLAYNASDASTADMLFNDFAAPQERQLWSDFDFNSLDVLVGMNDIGMSDTTTLNGPVGGSDAAPHMQNTELQPDQGGYVQDPSVADWFDPFLTGMSYPDPDFDGMLSESRTAQSSLHPAFVGQTAGCDTVPALLGPADVFGMPAPDDKVAGDPAKPSQRQDAKNALLIHYKEQGMSYKDIKALGGFEEAESTLRGRYRTLTKPKEERVRKPEWNDRDVSALYQLGEQSRNSRLEGPFAFRSSRSFYACSFPKPMAFI